MCAEYGGVNVLRNSRTPFALRVASCAAAWVVGLGLAHAGTISMNVQTSVAQSNLVIRIENLGDEAAHNVAAEVTFQGVRVRSPDIPRLAPNAPQGVGLPISTRALNGTYPVVVVVHFEDVNGYPFSSVSVNMMRGAMALSSPIQVAMQGRKIHGKGRVKGRLVNTSRQPIQAVCRIVHPAEILCNAPEQEVEIAAGRETTVQFEVENFSAMPAASYPIFLIVEHDEEERHFAVAASAVHTLFGASVFRSPGFWGAAGLAVLVLVAVMWGRVRRNRQAAR